MPSVRRVLNIFLASPGDLVDERRAAKGVVDEVALTARELNWSLELLGWEDTLPGAQRPQGAINEDLDKADLFVGLLWRRWGQPTGHPDYSSGFEEEFQRANEHRSKSRSPEMWLFFKDVDVGQLQDPGDQLQKVLRFKEKCGLEKKHFFKEFRTTEHWTEFFRSTLSRYVARLGGGATSEPVGEGFEPTSVGVAKPSIVASPSPKARSLLQLAEILKDLAEGGDPTAHVNDEGALQSARLYLVGHSLLALSQTSSGLVNTHELNTLYRLRTALDLLPFEKALLQRTVLSDKAGVKPGWFWFPSEQEALLRSVAFYAFFEVDTDVRRGAFSLLTKARVRRDDWVSIAFEHDTINGQSAEVQAAFWDYLEAIVRYSLESQEGMT